MNAAEIRRFVDSRKAGGLGEKDARDLVNFVGPTKARQLERVGDRYAPMFTDRGSKTFEKLTGHKPELRASTGGEGGTSSVDLRAGRSAAVPRAWKPVVQVANKMKELIDEGESVTMRLKSGRMISMEASEQMTEFVQKGYFKLYKNERDNSDYDDNGRIIWYPAYYLVPTPAFKMVEDQVEKFAARAERITTDITQSLEKLHRTMHASRVNGLQPFNLEQIKAEVAAELPKAKRAIIAYEDAVEKFAQDTQHLDYPNGEVYLMLFAKKALAEAGPRIDAISLRDLDFTKDLIRANELLLGRPEVESVDPGFGIRINVNTDTLVKNGGDYTKWKEEVTALMHDQLITGELNFDKNNNWDGVLEAAQKKLQDAVGAANVRDGYSMGDKDFPDRVRGTEVTLYVKEGALAEAQRHIPELRALFAPHGMDMKHFELNVEVDR